MKVIYVDGHSRDAGSPFESDVSDSSGSGQLRVRSAHAGRPPFHVLVTGVSGDAGLITCTWSLLYIGRLVTIMKFLRTAWLTFISQLPDLPDHDSHSITLKYLYDLASVLRY